MAKLESLQDLLLEQLQDLYDAEHQLTKALPKMAGAASNTNLQNAFNEHLSETERHVRRLEQAFEALGKRAERKTCKAMQGLVAEGSEVIEEQGDPQVKDAALIAAAQRVEHYEIAGYGSARTFAQTLGENRVADLLQNTLDEEGAADKKLTQIAESQVNERAR
ncbi:MAG: ferritin-like domain-containing protein [Anaerolineae bacterium]|nr:ferritin-like domain-containing protein [Anaerolineae bacterium]